MVLYKIMGKITVKMIAVLELLIGFSTICGPTAYAILDISKKPPSVFIFILLAGIVSSLIGIGLFNYKQWARVLLVFFSGYVIIIKIMISANLLHLDGAILTFPSASLKNCVSVIYHGFVIFFLTNKTVKGYFVKR